MPTCTISAERAGAAWEDPGRIRVEPDDDETWGGLARKGNAVATREHEDMDRVCQREFEALVRGVGMPTETVSEEQRMADAFEGLEARIRKLPSGYVRMVAIIKLRETRSLCEIAAIGREGAE